jgi:hypothetical protein
MIKIDEAKLKEIQETKEAEEAKKASAKAKLAVLGLNEEEIKSILK